jgi:F-type H+-transporting ATPase subunit b
MESLISTFHIDWKIIIAQAINFAVVVFVLYRFAIKPLKKNLDERKTIIDQGLTDAKTNAEMLDTTKREYEEIISKARRDADELFKKAKSAAEDRKKILFDEAEKEAKTVIEQTKKQLGVEKSKMIEDAKKEMANLVISATGKVLSGVASPEIDKKLLEEALH